MSGMPSPDKVKSLRDSLRDFSWTRNSVAELRKSLAETKKLLELRESELAVMESRIKEKLREMDVVSPANFGWELRHLEMLVMMSEIGLWGAEMKSLLYAVLILCSLLLGCASRHPKQPAMLKFPNASIPLAPLSLKLNITRWNGQWVTLTPTITSAVGIYQEVWSCENGSVRDGEYPDWYVPPTDGSETPVQGIVCEYTKSGTYHPNLQITDVNGNRAYASALVVIP